MPHLYLDNAATTRVDDAVVQAMVEAMTVDYGNPSSAHRLGLAASARLEAARQQVADALGAAPREVYFTSGGTEANALGILGPAAHARGRHVVVSAIEHPSVGEAARRLVERGFAITEVAPGRDGVVAAERLAEAVGDETALVALMLVSNELGTIQPVFEAARLVKQRAPKAHFHVDAVQGVGKVRVDVRSGPIDSLALSAHKIHGPKGAGALWLRPGARVTSLTVGGGQERNVRPGTQGVPGAVGLGLAVALAEASREASGKHLASLGERLIAGARALVPGLRLNGDRAQAVPHVISLGFPGLPAEPLLHALEGRGVYVSAGSACASKDKKPSPTLRAIGLPDDVGALRFSCSRHTTADEIEQALRALAAAVREVRP